MKILIIEDETRAAKRLEQLVRRVLDAKGMVHHFYETLDSVSSSVEFLATKPHLDLVFMDIHLADGLSFEILEHVPILAPVIFTTAFDEYAIKAFQVHSIDYLLKPIDEQHLEKAVEKLFSLKTYFSNDRGNSTESALEQGARHFSTEKIAAIFDQLQQQQNRFKSRFLVQNGNSMISIETADIAYFSSEYKVSWLVCNDGKKYSLDYTLEQIQALLNPQYFFRLNRQYIAHIQAVKRFSASFNGKLSVTLQPSAPEEVIVGREKAASFKEWLDS
ncbi:MAG: LytTR family DNA-binding domain-containing protein [Candidatus Kapabacteria bacterium]|jgi:DNA-binding LytR/AlgR family response regulator|nr:LytTR family DNA-binding domain-containing protein [Candidatus Kapabacteria bacterium]